MKKNVFHLLFMIIMMALILVSCKSTPDASEIDADKEAAAEKAAAAERAAELQAEEEARRLSAELEAELATRLNEAQARAQAARQQAMDFQCPDYFPSDWEGLEALLEAAGNASEYNAAADEYNELFNKTIPLYAQAREDELMAAREQLINSGFTQYIPEYLKAADDLALAALDQYEAGDYYKSRETTKEALKEYETLLLGSRVFLARQEITDRGFVEYDPENFSKADEVVLAALELYEAGNKEEAVTNAEEALLRYNLVLSSGWVIYASNHKDSATLERQGALNERANIAARERFREAERLFNDAEEQFAIENFNDAALLYLEAQTLYEISRDETAKSRKEAEEAIERARVQIEQSNESASEAERLIEGGSR
ncbi:MAG: hypothetical protein FWD13_09450 [Treponema sp.]|nr:hypothetical protein [Treponema sp.]